MDSITRDDAEGCVLRQMVASNNIVAVDVLLQQKANINGACGGSTVLHAAVATNDENLIELLLKKGVDVDKKDNGGITPVQRAAMEGHEKVGK